MRCTGWRWVEWKSFLSVRRRTSQSIPSALITLVYTDVLVSFFLTTSASCSTTPVTYLEEVHTHSLKLHHRMPDGIFLQLRRGVRVGLKGPVEGCS